MKVVKGKYCPAEDEMVVQRLMQDAERRNECLESSLAIDPSKTKLQGMKDIEIFYEEESRHNQTGDCAEGLSLHHP